VPFAAVSGKSKSRVLVVIENTGALVATTMLPAIASKSSALSSNRHTRWIQVLEGATSPFEVIISSGPPDPLIEH
jgi:hypothetical protein